MTGKKNVANVLFDMWSFLERVVAIALIFAPSHRNRFNNGQDKYCQSNTEPPSTLHCQYLGRNYVIKAYNRNYFTMSLMWFNIQDDEQQRSKSSSLKRSVSRRSSSSSRMSLLSRKVRIICRSGGNIDWVLIYGKQAVSGVNNEEEK